MAQSLGTESWPVEIRLKKDERRLEISFDDGTEISLPAELLRVESPSAEVQGHSATQKQIVPGKRFVAIRALVPVGHYAIRIDFDDGHDTGIYSWRYLYEMGKNQEQLMAAYLEQLEKNGLRRG
jgi:DUF971 family protein